MKKLQLSFKDWIQNVSNTNNNKTKQNDTKSLSITTTKNIKPSHAKKRRPSNSSIKSTSSNKSVSPIAPIPYKKRKTKKQKTIIETSEQNMNDEFNFDLRRPTSLRTFGELWSHEFQLEVACNYKETIEQKTFFIQNNHCGNNDSGEQKYDQLEDYNMIEFDVTDKQRKVVQYFHDNYYGSNEVFESAFGIRPVIYCDWTASGKILECVERYLSKEMYTLYANTHTTTSITGIQTSKFRSEARTIILESLNGNVNEDVVIFTGSGVTGAIYKISRILMKSIGKSYKPETTLVFISIYEHNSNIFIWKELGCKIIVIPEDNLIGGLDLK
eukprot:9697_1